MRERMGFGSSMQSKSPSRKHEEDFDRLETDHIDDGDEKLSRSQKRKKSVRIAEGGQREEKENVFSHNNRSKVDKMDNLSGIPKSS